MSSALLSGDLDGDRQAEFLLCDVIVLYTGNYANATVWPNQSWNEDYFTVSYSAGADLGGYDFGAVPPASTLSEIQGAAFQDRNSDKLWEANEAGIFGLHPNFPVNDPPVAGFGYALALDGVNDGVELGTAPFTGLANWTFSAWINPAQLQYGMLYSEGGPGATLHIASTGDGAVSVSAWNAQQNGNWINFSTPAGVIAKGHADGNQRVEPQDVLRLINRLNAAAVAGSEGEGERDTAETPAKRARPGWLWARNSETELGLLAWQSAVDAIAADVARAWQGDGEPAPPSM